MHMRSSFTPHQLVTLGNYDVRHFNMFPYLYILILFIHFILLGLSSFRIYSISFILMVVLSREWGSCLEVDGA